ncbi:MAG: tRNA lysidine(34) synthetase TilS [Pseudomonadota bacterium]
MADGTSQEPPGDPRAAVLLPGAMPEGPVGVAVSGGSDSIALLLLLRARGVPVAVATVDHGLRPEAAAEARTVAALCARLSVAHDTLTISPLARGNLAARAREARLGALAGWAEARGLATLALGHTRDDQAETLLMRLARGSGVDGLAAMAPKRKAYGVTLWRPLLDTMRAELRAWLTAQGVPWIDDPSNEDPTSERVRARLAVAALGLDTRRLAQTAERMARARVALEEATVTLAKASATAHAIGSVTLRIASLQTAPQEITLRLLAHALGWVGAQPYRPREDALSRLAEGLAAGLGGTLHGCEVFVSRGAATVVREWAAMAHVGPHVGDGTLYDGRWQLEPIPDGCHVAPLGPNGWAALPATARAATPHRQARATPALWRGDELLSAPQAGMVRAWTCTLVTPPRDFATSILSH